MKKIRRFLYMEFILPVKNAYIIYRENIALKKAKKYADFLSKQANYRKYIVMKNHLGSYQAMNKAHFLLMKRRGVFNKKCSWDDIVSDANYVTQKK